MSRDYYFSYFFPVFKIPQFQISFVRVTNTGKVSRASLALRTQQNKHKKLSRIAFRQCGTILRRATLTKDKEHESGRRTDLFPPRLVSPDF